MQEGEGSGNIEGGAKPYHNSKGRFTSGGTKGGLSVDNGSEKGIISAEALRLPAISSSTISEKIAQGEYSTKLSEQQFKKHKEGTSQFEDYKASRISKGSNPQSKLLISKNETQKIINKFAGTGIVRVDSLVILCHKKRLIVVK